METIVKPRAWGNSLGITIPKKIIDEEKIREGEEIVVSIRKKKDITILRGLVKFRQGAQQIKDNMRKGWE